MSSFMSSYPLAFSGSLFFIIKHVSIHPIAIMSSSTIDIPSRAPRASTVAVFVCAWADDWFSRGGSGGVFPLNVMPGPTFLVHGGVMVVVVTVHWVGAMDVVIVGETSMAGSKLAQKLLMYMSTSISQSWLILPHLSVAWIKAIMNYEVYEDVHTIRWC